MSAKYVMQEMVDLNREGETLLHPRMVMERCCGTEELARMMARASTFGEGEIAGLIRGIGLCMARLMADGCSVKLDGIGTFAPSLVLREDKERAQEVNKEIAKYVDVMIGNEEDFTACLGFEVEGTDANLSKLNTESFKKMIEKVVKAYPNFQAVATTLRQVKTATVNDWSAIVWQGGQFYKAAQRDGLEIFDRVGGGDSFASGLIYGLMVKGDPALAVEYGAAHGALAMTTPGDTSMARLEEVEKLVKGGGARVDR